MAFAPTSPVTGSAQTGLTSPTYTIAADTAPDASTGKQYAVTGLGGTQTGVTTHSVGSPFTHTFVKPKAFRYLGSPNPVTGVVKSVPRNSYKLITRKGVTVLAGQPVTNLQITTIIDVPAGSDLVDSPNVRAALSAHLGTLSQTSSGIGDTTVTGIF